MAWDLAISEHGDLIVSGNRDLQGISGSDLIEQRMRLRLAVHRGSWVYDENKTFGSNLYQLIGMAPALAAQSAPAYVQEALRDMSSEIIVDDVQAAYSDTDVTIIVLYHLIVSPDELGGSVGLGDNERQISITLPLAGGVF